MNYTRNYAKTWCEECKNEAVQQQKDTFKQLEESEELRKRAEQKRLFEESQKYMQEQQLKETHVFRIQEEADYYNAVMSQVCSYAKQKMERYMSNPSFTGNCSHIEIFNVYKILYMPMELLVKTLGMIERSQLNSQYRKLALILHPDKNRHEQSNDAFKKLNQAYGTFKE